MLFRKIAQWAIFFIKNFFHRIDGVIIVVMLYTGKGDDGTTSLYGDGVRVKKDSPRIAALGDIDELNSFLGVVYADAETHPDIQATLRLIQEHLFVFQAELARANKYITPSHLRILEDKIRGAESRIAPPRSFILAGASMLAARLDCARAIARRAERTLVMLQEREAVSPKALAYINRLSSLLYGLAREAAEQEGKEETAPSY